MISQKAKTYFHDKYVLPILKVIDSCENKKQLSSCLNWVTNLQLEERRFENFKEKPWWAGIGWDMHYGIYIREQVNLVRNIIKSRYNGISTW